MFFKIKLQQWQTNPQAEEIRHSMWSKQNGALEFIVRPRYLLRSCSIQIRTLFIIVSQTVNELKNQHWTKRAKIARWCCTRLKNRLPDISETAGFYVWFLYMCALTQHCTSNFLEQYCLRRIWATLTRQYSYAILPQHGRHNIV